MIVLAVALVGAVLFLGLSGGEDGTTGAGSSAPSEPPAATAEPEPPTPDEFCADFRVFADASNAAVASPTADTGEALVEAARSLLEMPTPLGMTDGARASLDQLVAGSLDVVAEVPGVTVDVAPDPAYAAEPDLPAFDEYLLTTCPA